MNNTFKNKRDLQIGWNRTTNPPCPVIGDFWYRKDLMSFCYFDGKIHILSESQAVYIIGEMARQGYK